MADRLSLIHPHGYMRRTDGEGGVIEADTLQCVHCGRHWAVKKGSGTGEGYCHRCAGPVCGPGCEVCVPAEQQLSNMEQGRDVGFRPIIVGVV